MWVLTGVSNSYPLPHGSFLPPSIAYLHLPTAKVIPEPGFWQEVVWLQVLHYAVLIPIAGLPSTPPKGPYFLIASCQGLRFQLTNLGMTQEAFSPSQCPSPSTPDLGLLLWLLSQFQLQKLLSGFALSWAVCLMLCFSAKAFVLSPIACAGQGQNNWSIYNSPAAECWKLPAPSLDWWMFIGVQDRLIL